MTRIDSQSKFFCVFGSDTNPFEFIEEIVFSQSVWVMSGMKFNNIGIDIGSRIDLNKIRFNKKRNRNIRLMEPIDREANLFYIINDIQTPFRSEFLPFFGNQGSEFRLNVARYFDYFIHGGHLKIEFGSNHFAQKP